MIITCNSCSFRKDCDLKRGHDAALKVARQTGLRIASISIHCDRRLSLLPVGQPVEVMAAARWVNNGDEEDSIEWVKRTATVIGNSSKNPRKLRVWLDEPAGFDSMIRSLWPKDVTPIAGPLRQICKGCGLRPVGAPAPESWHCEVCSPCETPDDWNF
jgi:hypothetical protein